MALGIALLFGIPGGMSGTLERYLLEMVLGALFWNALVDFRTLKSLHWKQREQHSRQLCFINCVEPLECETAYQVASARSWFLYQKDTHRMMMGLFG